MLNFWEIQTSPESTYTRSCDFIWPFLMPYMGVIPNIKTAFIFHVFKDLFSHFL